MTDSNDSTLFGNTDDLYASKRHYDEYEPFTQALPPSAEPLFPAARVDAAPAETNGVWTDSTPDHGVGVQPHHEVGTQHHHALYDQGYRGQSYESQSYDNLSYGAAEPQDEQARATDAMPAVSPFSESALSGVDLDDATQSHVAASSTSLSTPSTFDFAPSTNDEQAAANHRPATNEKELLFNRHFAVLMDLMQHGAWPQALEKLQAMRAEYPNVGSLEALLDEATLKSELMAEWTHKIKGRRLTVGQEWLIRRSLPFLLLLVLFVSGVIFYRAFVAPSRQVVAMERANLALIEEATGLLQVGQINEAIQLYNVVLSRDANNNAAQQGLVEASRLSGLAVTYDVAIRVANSGNLKRSLLMLQTIKAKSPSFRDIDGRITRVHSLLEAEVAYRLAEKSFAQRRWIDAIRYYEQTQLLAADYQAVRVGLQLSATYYMASQRLMTQWPSPEFGTEQIRNFLRRAQEVNGQNETIGIFLTHLDDFIKGERQLNNNNLGQAVKEWHELYEAQPAFLGGYLAEQLYRAYLTLAAEIRAADPQYASELYTLAAAMPVHDSSEARNQLQNLGAAVPAAQPTPTPQPTVAFVIPVAAAAPAAPAETPTPEPSPTPANAYQGWILFRTTRGGFEQIYMMRGDGSEQQLAPEEISSRIDTIYQEERRGPDGRLAYVQSATGRSDANIYIASSDGLNSNVITDYNGDEYDPVWSRTGDRIAFVANHTGNDEIWTMRADGGEQRQLTSNNWEWDKHPTWSPDGNQIAFFSNRSGQRQIWLMDSNGSYPRNLSNNRFDDWDPVWIK